MKKIIVILLSFITAFMCVAFVGCKGDYSDKKDEDNNSDGGETEESYQIDYDYSTLTPEETFTILEDISVGGEYLNKMIRIYLYYTYIDEGKTTDDGDMKVIIILYAQGKNSKNEDMQAGLRLRVTKGYVIPETLELDEKVLVDVKCAKDDDDDEVVLELKKLTETNVFVTDDFPEHDHDH